jgi:hypothetical protein
MDPNTLNLIEGAAGAAAGGEKVYVEEVFSTDVYSNPAGAPNPRTVTNGINFLEEGGLLWVKNRSYESGGYGRRHVLYSTANSATSSTSTHALSSNTTDDLEDYSSNATLTWKTDGWSVPSGDGDVNGSYFGDYAAWSFRKAPGFFDVVTYTGDYNARDIPHSLGSVPGMILLKRTDSTSDWVVYHVSAGNQAACALNSAVAFYTSNSTIWDSTTPTATSFRVGANANTNSDQAEYVAYVFASDDQSFGEGGNESIIKCGSYVGVGGGGSTTVDVGFEPQFLITKKDGNGEWRINDVMRGIASGADAQLNANTNGAEIAGNTTCDLTPTGFISNGSQNDSDTYIYMAIRRGPMKTPEDATEVFDVVAYDGTGGAHDVPISPSYADLVFYKRREASDNWGWTSRLTGNLAYMTSNDDAMEANRAADDALEYDKQFAFGLVGNSSGEVNYNGESYISYTFKRAPGFFDVVCYEGTGSAHTEVHNLGVVPEMMIAKQRSGNGDHWHVYAESVGNGKYAKMNADGAFLDVGAAPNVWDETSPTSTVFTVGTDAGVNRSGWTYAVYLFASCPGVSKVGSYTGTGNDIDVDCGFTAGARFVMIKRTDTTGDWYVWDTERGIVSGDDPYLFINDNAVEVTNTDYIDPFTTGFTVTSSAPDALNVSSGEYIYLAIA